jgi:hypothetical protein
MLCKTNQGLIDTLLSLKSKEDIVVETINKIASTAATNKKIGEVAELQSYLKL